MLWKSLIDTKSKSIIRITCQDKKQPAHSEIVRYVRQNYYEQTIDVVTKIESVITEKMLDAIMDKYKDLLSMAKINLIKKYLLSKAQLLREIYRGETL